MLTLLAAPVFFLCLFLVLHELPFAPGGIVVCVVLIIGLLFIGLEGGGRGGDTYFNGSGGGRDPDAEPRDGPYYYGPGNG